MTEPTPLTPAEYQADMNRALNDPTHPAAAFKSNDVAWQKYVAAQTERVAEWRGKTVEIGGGPLTVAGDAGTVGDDKALTTGDWTADDIKAMDTELTKQHGPKADAVRADARTGLTVLEQKYGVLAVEELQMAAIGAGIKPAQIMNLLAELGRAAGRR